MLKRHNSQGRAILGWVLLRLFRGMEKFMPVEWLRLGFEPVAKLLARRPEPETVKRAWLPASLQAPASEPRYLATAESHLARLLTFIPDRFNSPKWQGRCRIEELDRLRVETSPVILATLHFGPIYLLRYWLRAHGLAVTTLVDEPPQERTHTKKLKDWLSNTASGLHDVPHIISRHELLKVRQCQQPGRMLMISVDHTSGKCLALSQPEYQVQLATGAIRLAASMKARLVPCLIAQTGPWQYTITLGRAVPQDLLAGAGHEAAARHLWNEFLPVLQRYPGQMGVELEYSFRPALAAAATADCTA